MTEPNKEKLAGTGDTACILRVLPRYKRTSSTATPVLVLKRMFPPVFTIPNNLAGRLPNDGPPVGYFPTPIVALTTKEPYILTHRLFAEWQIHEIIGRTLEIFQTIALDTLKGGGVDQSKEGVRPPKHERARCQKVQENLGRYHPNGFPTTTRGEKRPKAQFGGTHRVTQDHKDSALQEQEPPKATMIPFTNAGSNEQAVMIKSCHALVAGLAVMAPERRGKATVDTLLAASSTVVIILVVRQRIFFHGCSSFGQLR